MSRTRIVNQPASQARHDGEMPASVRRLLKVMRSWANGWRAKAEDQQRIRDQRDVLRMNVSADVAQHEMDRLKAAASGMESAITVVKRWARRERRSNKRSKR